MSADTGLGCWTRLELPWWERVVVVIPLAGDTLKREAVIFERHADAVTRLVASADDRPRHWVHQQGCDGAF